MPPSRRVFWLITSFIAVLTLHACDIEPLDTASRQSAVKCSGQYDKLVTTSSTRYLGYRENAVGGDPALVGHAAAAELLYSRWEDPANERFAVAWVRASDRLVYVRAYDTATKGFSWSPQQLHPSWSSVPAGWVRTLGFDDNCLAVPTSYNTCAWFTWEDSLGSGWVDYRAVAPNGSMSSTTWTFQGHQPSGDTGQIFDPYQGYIRRKLLAYITTERTQVRAKLLNNSGNQIAEVTLATLSGVKAYQTAVAWSSNEQRWLVAWTEHPYPTYATGVIKTRAVDFNGQLCQNCTLNTIMNCEGSMGFASQQASGNPVAPQANDSKACYGIWLASSYYSVATDRYRIHQYGKHARLGEYGAWVERDDGYYLDCSVFCPITEASFWYGSDFTPFQMLQFTGAGSDHARLVRGAFKVPAYYSAGEALASPFINPQAFRSNGAVAVAVATTDQQGPYDLKLSIVDVRANGCPP